MALKREDVLAFLKRDWEAIRRHKDASMLSWTTAKGPSAALRLGDRLREHVWARASAAKAQQSYADLIDLRRKLDLVHAKRR